MLDLQRPWWGCARLLWTPWGARTAQPQLRGQGASPLAARSCWLCFQLPRQSALRCAICRRKGPPSSLSTRRGPELGPSRVLRVLLRQASIIRGAPSQGRSGSPDLARWTARPSATTAMPRTEPPAASTSRWTCRWVALWRAPAWTLHSSPPAGGTAYRQRGPRRALGRRSSPSRRGRVPACQLVAGPDARARARAKARAAERGVKQPVGSRQGPHLAFVWASQGLGQRRLMEQEGMELGAPGPTASWSRRSVSREHLGGSP